MRRFLTLPLLLLLPGALCAQADSLPAGIWYSRTFAAIGFDEKYWTIWGPLVRWREGYTVLNRCGREIELQQQAYRRDASGTYGLRVLPEKTCRILLLRQTPDSIQLVAANAVAVERFGTPEPTWFYRPEHLVDAPLQLGGLSWVLFDDRRGKSSDTALHLAVDAGGAYRMKVGTGHWKVPPGRYTGRLSDSLYRHLLRVAGEAQLDKVPWPNGSCSHWGVSHLEVRINGRSFRFLQTCPYPEIAAGLVQFLARLPMELAALQGPGEKKE